MKNTRKKMLLSSIAMLLVALIALGSATYAWFTINKEVTADTMQVKAATAAGLQITGKNGGADSNWVRDYNFTLAEQTLSPISLGFTAAGIGSAGYLPSDAKAQGAWSTGSTDYTGWTAGAAIPTSTVQGIAAGTEASNANANFAAYRVGVRSSDADIPGVTMSLTFTDATGATYKASDFVRVAVIDEADSNKVVACIASGGADTDAVTAIASGAPTTTAKQINSVNNVSIGTVTKATPKYYTILVWFEGQDEQCVDNYQAAQGELGIKFAF